MKIKRLQPPTMDLPEETAIDKILKEILKELYTKYSDTDPYEWVDYIREELIDVVDALENGGDWPYDYRTKLIQAAATIISAIKSWDKLEVILNKNE